MDGNNNIDLVTIGNAPSHPWSLGKRISASGTIQSLHRAVQQLNTESDGYVLFLLDKLTVDESALLSAIKKSNFVQVLYDPTVTNSFQIPRILQFISPGSYFNLKTSQAGYSIWDMSWGCLLIKKEVLNTVGFLDTDFQSPEGALIDWIHRMLFSGVLFQCEKLLTHPAGQPSSPIPVEDEWRLVNNRLGRQWVRWCAVRYTISGFINPVKALSAYRNVRGSNHPDDLKIDHSKWRDFPISGEKPKISIIIPTIERYPYLVTVLTQLKEQTILPVDVTVIDQTPKQFRKPELFHGYEKIGLRYFTMEESGQCRSRNLGLLECTGDYILFIDDDVEIKPDLLERHIKCLHYFDADVSCGVCDEVDAGPIPKDYTFIRHSDVFPTNNGMVRRSALERSGLFDMAFDHGQRADGDLGARIYKSGARMILNPEIRVLHHRAPCGGLRIHDVRKMTYASSRKYITHYRIPHITELYLNKIHFSIREQREYIILSLLGTFSVKGSKWKKITKIGYALMMMPSVVLKIYTRNKKVSAMLKKFPIIPYLEKVNLPDHSR